MIYLNLMNFVSVCVLKSTDMSLICQQIYTPTYTSSMQELIMQGMQQKLEKSCFRCKKNTWHVEFNYILQPLEYHIWGGGY